MELIINGDKREVQDVATLDQLVSRLGLPPDARGIAVAVNATVIPRGAWAKTKLHTGDEVDVIHAVQGG